MIIPRLNEKDLPEIPVEVRDKLEFITAETVDDVLDAALEPARERRHDGSRARERPYGPAGEGEEPPGGVAAASDAEKRRAAKPA